MTRPTTILFAVLLGASGFACSGDDSDGSSGGTKKDSGAAGDGAGGQAGAGGMGVDSGAGMGGVAGMAGSPGDASADAADASTGPMLLSDTGLYDDIVAGTLAADVAEYQPEFVLWTDGATKRRFVFLPSGEQIDTTDMDYWQYPIGTKVWKEFTRDGVRVETRLLWRRGPGRKGWFRMAYQWRADQSDADAVPGGLPDASGTPHDIPDTAACEFCHGNHSDNLLSFSAIQLDHDLGGLNLAQLIADGRLTQNPTLPLDLPGTAADQAALGYLHANCGNCHNPRSSVSATVSMQLWLEIGTLGAVDTTTTYTTTVNQMLDTMLPLNPMPAARIVPGSAATSAVHAVMGERGNDAQMPPLGTEVIDTAGRADVEAWINGLM